MLAGRRIGEIPNAYVGTAGWAMSRATAGDFPSLGSHLERYATRLRAAEINTSFHRPHRPQTYARWAASVPEHFRFAAKLPRTITHERRLIDAGDLLARFIDEVGGLGSKLGVLLIQLPPSLAFDAPVADRFLRDLCRLVSAGVACEPRHASWASPEADALLRSYHVARVAADPAPFAGADRPGGWDGLYYSRLHGSPRMYYSDYEAEVLAAAGRDVSAAAARQVPAWCIFDNTAGGHALGNALTVAGLPAEAAEPAGIAGAKEGRPPP